MVDELSMLGVGISLDMSEITIDIIMIYKVVYGYHT